MKLDEEKLSRSRSWVGKTRVGWTLIDPTTGQHVQTNRPSLIIDESYFLDFESLRPVFVNLGQIGRLGTFPKCVDQFKKNPFAKKVISM